MFCRTAACTGYGVFLIADPLQLQHEIATHAPERFGNFHGDIARLKIDLSFRYGSVIQYWRDTKSRKRSNL